MPIRVEMPRLSDTMEEGTLIKWRVKEGDSVKAGDVLADVETDKATMELETFDDGTVAKLAVEEGATLAVGGLILILAEEGEDVKDAANAGAKSDGKKQAGKKSAKARDQKEDDQGEAEKEAGGEDEEEAEDEPAGDDADDSAQDADTEGSEGGTAEKSEKSAKAPASGRLRVSPLARKIAEEHGVDLSSVRGTGPDGRIIKRDVLGALEPDDDDDEADAKRDGSKPARPATAAPAARPTAAPVSAPALEAKTIAVSNMRKTIARRLVESKTTIPHFTITIAVNVEALASLRETINAQLESQGVKLSVNDFIVRAAALALVEHPAVNSSWTDGGIKQHGTVNIGVAVALPQEKGGGLVVPTIRDAHHKGLRQISAETKALAKKARGAGLSKEEMSDGTFTVSNLGMFGVDHFEAIINPPQAAILAVGGAMEKPVVRDGQIVIGKEMTCTLSADHRVIDGAMGAIFLNTLQRLLEGPAGLMI